jgi:hypothetical protein
MTASKDFPDLPPRLGQVIFKESELLKNFEDLISGINNDKLEEELEENEIKEIEEKHRKYLNRKERERRIKSKCNLLKCLSALTENVGLYE